MSRRFQFSLKSFLWLIAVMAAFLAGAPLDRYLAERTSDPSETKVWAALDEETEFNFADKPLFDVVEYLQRRHRINIQLDNKAVADAGIGSDTPITRSVKGITLRSALWLLLDELDLTYVVRHGVLLVTSKMEAEYMTNTTYPMLNLETIPWLVLVAAAFVGGILLGRKSRQRPRTQKQIQLPFPP